ncbi:MAG TPA: hypothetical protein DHW14_02115, partial [Clostridiales bacterium]|nr:hypothetical protein [Clostridiales bacterium]
MSLVDTIRSLLPELSRVGSSEAVFGDPLEVGGVVVIPVARVGVGFVGLGTAAEKALGGGAWLEPAAVIVVKDDDVEVLPIEVPRGRPGAGRGPHGPPDLGLGPVGDAVVTIAAEIRQRLQAARRSAGA